MVADVVATFGTVDILVGSAGIMINKELEDYSEQEWDDTIDINLKGNFLLSQAIVPIMKEKKYGKIIFVRLHRRHARLSQRGALLREQGRGLHDHARACGGDIEVRHQRELHLAGQHGHAAQPALTGRPRVRETHGELHAHGPGLHHRRRRWPGAAVFLASDDASAVHGLDLIVDDGWCAI